VTGQNAGNDDAPRGDGLRGVFVACETARAKVNLTLEILGRRPDGYHELRSLVVFADFGDTLALDDPSAPFSLRIEGPFAPALEGGNLVEAAAALHARTSGRMRGAFRLTKRIPVAAGLGGGSADAAAALRLLEASEHPARAPQETLLPHAARLGADIPVCLLSRPALMTGIGERLQVLPAFPRIPALLVNPLLPLATAAVFRELRAGPPGGDSRRGDEIPASQTLDAVLDYARGSRNDLEAPARRLLPAVGEILACLERLPGVLLARLSGSGPTCFALFRDDVQAEAAARSLRMQHPKWWVEATTLG
jgi:4-diphosphocytidyl-2-C-methyl-D-erythritol kinase